MPEMSAPARFETSRRNQGLPARVEDLSALRAVATLLTVAPGGLAASSCRGTRQSSGPMSRARRSGNPPRQRGGGQDSLQAADDSHEYPTTTPRESPGGIGLTRIASGASFVSDRTEG